MKLRIGVNKPLSEIYRSYRVGLIFIGSIQPIVLVITLWALYELNLAANQTGLPSINKIIINSSLLGFVGSLLYFSRKVYLYLITDKFHRLATEYKIETDIKEQDNERFKSIVMGYYIYLATRPVSGFVVGPVLVMFVLAGLTTFSKAANDTEMGLSQAGVYLIYVISFLGGYSSSDLFDYFSNLGKKLRAKLDV